MISNPILRRLGASNAALRARAATSPNYRDGAFVSHEPTHLITDAPSGSEALGHPGLEAFRSRGNGRPAGTIPLVTPLFPSVATDLALTWLGHASSLVELEGRRFLLDPVFGERVSPSLHIGPKRLHPPPCQISDLPAVDAVLISHDHYDHLDEPSIAQLERAQAPRYIVPIGVDLHLQAWGVPADRITALDWREETTAGGVHVICTEARHFSGRGLVRNQSLWAGWALRGERRSAWFAGDSGPTHRFEEIGRDLGPFDLTIIPIGAYSRYWPEVHLDPEQAIAAHREVTRGAPTSVMVPVHWATFNLAMHQWAEPIRRARAAADLTTNLLSDLAADPTTDVEDLIGQPSPEDPDSAQRVADLDDLTGRIGARPGKAPGQAADRAADQAPVLLACPRVGARIDVSGDDPAFEVARHQDPWWDDVDCPEPTETRRR